MWCRLVSSSVRSQASWPRTLDPPASTFRVLRVIGVDPQAQLEAIVLKWVILAVWNIHHFYPHFSYFPLFGQHNYRFSTNIWTSLLQMKEWTFPFSSKVGLKPTRETQLTWIGGLPGDMPGVLFCRRGLNYTVVGRFCCCSCCDLRWQPEGNREV